jgi:hypothetical protein
MAKTTTAPVRPNGPGSSSALDRFFDISRRGSTLPREVRGGLVTFFTMAYIVVLNPLIIGTQTDATGAFLGGGDINRAKVLVAAGTALIAGVMTILMGVVANFPLALATGLGLNAFVAYGIAKLPDDLGRRDGPGGHGGDHHHDPRCHGVPSGGAARRATAAEDRHLRRNRPVHHLHRAG